MRALPFLLAALALAPALASAAPDSCEAIAKTGDRARALDCYQKLVTKNPADHEARNAIGALLAEKGDYTGAVTMFDAVLTADPKNGVAKNGKAMVLLVEKKYDEAFALLESALQDDPKNLQVLQNCGILALQTRKLDIAEGAFRRVLLLDPTHSGAHLGLGETMMLKGDGIQAQEHLLAVIGRNDKDSRAHWLMGKLLASTNPRLAVEYLERASYLAPGEAEIWYDLGLTRRLAGETRLAGQALTQAMKYAPEEPKILFELGRIHTDMNRFDLAEQHFDEALRKKPAPALKAQIHFHYALLREQQVRYQDAEAQYLQALRITPDDVPCLLNLGRIYAGQRRLSDARKVLDRAIKIAPSDAGVRYNLAVLMIEQGEVNPGKAELKKLIATLKPEDPLRGQAEEVLRGARPGSIPSSAATKKP